MKKGIHKKVFRSERGFVLIAAILACVILLAVGMLVIALTTGDLRVSTRTLGDKKALSAVETGIHQLTQNFDPGNLTNPALYNVWFQVDAANDPNSRYRFLNVAPSSLAPVPLPGYSIEAGQGWGMSRFTLTVEGENTAYGTKMAVEVGIGYGPVPTGTIYR